MQENARNGRLSGLFWVCLGILCGLLIWRFAGPLLGECRARAMTTHVALAPPESGLPYNDLPGVDLSALGPRQKFTLLHRAASERCTCGCKQTVAQCRHSDMDCDTSLRLARRIRDEVVRTVPAASP